MNKLEEFASMGWHVSLFNYPRLLSDNKWVLRLERFPLPIYSEEKPRMVLSKKRIDGKPSYEYIKPEPIANAENHVEVWQKSVEECIKDIQKLIKN